MSTKAKEIVKQLIPRPAKHWVRKRIQNRNLKRAVELLAEVPKASEQLSIAKMRQLQAQFDFPPEYGYDDDSVNRRGAERAALVKSTLPSSVESVLEVACWDGMVASHLARMGKTVTGIDFRDEGFDQRAFDAGVQLHKQDAAALQFADNSFDAAYSFDAFEHFADPKKVLQELIRVVKPGGYIYLRFGPLFMSPFGLHAYRKITVPYCQFLFSETTMQEFLKEAGVEPLDFNHCNGWSITRFRALWDSCKDQLDTISYNEGRNYAHLDLVIQYASVFKRETDVMDDLVASSIAVLFQKK